MKGCRRGVVVPWWGRQVYVDVRVCWSTKALPLNLRLYVCNYKYDRQLYMLIEGAIVCTLFPRLCLQNMPSLHPEKSLEPVEDAWTHLERPE